MPYYWCHIFQQYIRVNRIKSLRKSTNIPRKCWPNKTLGWHIIRQSDLGIGVSDENAFPSSYIHMQLTKTLGYHLAFCKALYQHHPLSALISSLSDSIWYEIDRKDNAAISTIHNHIHIWYNTDRNDSLSDQFISISVSRISSIIWYLSTITTRFISVSAYHQNYIIIIKQWFLQGKIL